jgi:hypothetical protein
MFKSSFPRTLVAMDKGFMGEGIYAVDTSSTSLIVHL